MREKIRCHHMDYSVRLAARVLLYAPSHIQDSTYHSICYTSQVLAGTRNSSMGPPWGFDLATNLRSLQAVLTDLHITDTDIQNKKIYLVNNYVIWRYFVDGARCSSVVRAFRSWCDGLSDRSFMGWTHWTISRSSQCSTTGVTKAVICAFLSVGWCI